MSNNKKRLVPIRRFKGFTDAWEQRKFGSLLEETRNKTTVEDEDTLISCAIDGMYLNSELFSHFRGSSNIGYLKIKKNDLILSAQNLHLGNCNVNLRFEHGIISPAYKVYDLVGCNPLFMQAWVKKDSTKDFFLKASTEGASVCRKNIVWEELYKQELPIPNIEEQTKVGEYFNSLDHLIALHQRKLDKLKRVKSAYLTEMFPAEGEREPKRRFPGFTGAWELRKFRDILLFSVPTNNLSRSKLNYENGNVKNIHYGDILVKFDSVVCATNSQIPFINEGEIEVRDSYLLRDGDIVIADTAEDESTGKSVEIYGTLGMKLVSGLHTIVARPKLSFASFYLGYYMNSWSYHKQLLPLMQGIKVLSLSKSNVAKTKVSYPKELVEQQKIGSFFKHLDELITLHQRKLDKLRKLKAAYLNEMFV